MTLTETLQGLLEKKRRKTNRLHYATCSNTSMYSLEIDAQNYTTLTLSQCNKIENIATTLLLVTVRSL